MATQVQWRGGSTAEHAAFTGAAREVTVDTQKKTLVVHDGSTAGGEPLLREDQANLPTSVTNGISVPSANNVAISTNGTGRLFVDSNGKVSATQGTVTLGTAGSFNGVINSADGIFLNIDSDGTTTNEVFVIGKDRTGTTGGSELLRVTEEGRLGLGTGSPASTLDVNGRATVAALTSSTSGYSSFTRTGTADSGAICEFLNASSSVLKIQKDGNVGVGTTIVNANLHVGGSGQQHILIGSTDAGGARLSLDGDSNGDGTGGDFAEIIHTTSGHLEIRARNPADDATMRFEVDAGEAFRVDSSKRLLVGTASTSADVKAVVSGKATSAIAAGALLIQRGESVSAANTALGNIFFSDSDVKIACQIEAVADAEWNTGGDTTDNPGRLVFSTTADGASSPTERMRITSGGDLLFGKTGDNFGLPGAKQKSTGTLELTADSTFGLAVNRLTDDGELVRFYQATTQEGSITVSGTTVSYNGAHLSRWSQLLSGQERTEILRGTVLSNIDEMCEWGEEENEQLNRMKVSDVEGDKNVAGVFQGWDDDDDTYINDFYCAMTGDFIIRIAQGVTVERGDLLMSAGDGTAKPQDDDIIRSKTIAKVTSTNVSCTHPDGSYCVPCVLMAC